MRCCQVLGPFKVCEGGTPSRRLNACKTCTGISAVWEVALLGQRWLPAHRRGPLVLMLSTQRRLLGHTSSWAVGSRVQV